MSTSTVAKTRFGSNKEVPAFINTGGVATLSATATLSSTTCQDIINNASGATNYTLPSGNIQLGTLKEVSAGTIGGGSVVILPPSGSKIVNGTTLQASASFAAAGASIQLQYVAPATWKVVRTTGTITFA